MAVFELAIADDDVARVFNAICNNYNWSENIANPNFDPQQEVDESTNPETIANPEDQGQFVHRIVRQFLSDHVTAYETNLAKEAAAAAADTSVDISDPQA